MKMAMKMKAIEMKKTSMWQWRSMKMVAKTYRRRNGEIIMAPSRQRKRRHGSQHLAAGISEIKRQS
jgi:hypothetical protein